MSAPLLLDSYFIEEVHVETNIKYRSAGEIDTLLDVDVEEARQRRAKDGAQPFSMRLSVNTNSKPETFKKAKYRISLVLFAQFHIAPGVPRDLADRLVALNAPSILYGLARGHVAQATALCPWGRALLPTFNFVKLRAQKPVPKKKKMLKKAKRRAKKAKS